MLQHELFTEKYRPKTFSDFVGIDKYKSIVELCNTPFKIPHFLFVGRAGVGKCVTKDSLIFIDNTLMSFSEFEKICFKENKFKWMTLSESGSFVEGLFYKEKTNELIKINLEDGTYIEGTKEHKIKIFDKEEGIIWKKLDEISLNDTVILSFNFNVFNSEELKINFKYIKKIHDSSKKNINLKGTLNKNIAYLIGIIIGNGSFYMNNINISTHKDWMKNKIIEIVKEELNIDTKYLYENKIKKVGINIASIQFLNLLKYLDVSLTTARFKNVPLSIKKSPDQIPIPLLYHIFRQA